MEKPTHALLGVLASLFPSVMGGTAGEPSRPLVATHYFYWYRWPTEHMNPTGDPRREGHRHHFPAPERVSYRDPAWHAEQFREMAACGIDVALPVYWGAPGAYERPSTRFSRDGLEPMVEALERLADEGAPAVKLGLFYDTTTLLNDVRGAAPAGGKADLRTAAGRQLFCDTVVEYFEQVPAQHWARVDGRALVVTYVSGFAAGWDGGLGGALRAAFARRFPGEGVFLVTDESWGDVGQDRTTAWGAALWGPRLFEGVAQIGPGYDDSPVPGRRTPLREREDGTFYRHSWQRAVASRPELVLIETWNEMHEGTEICHTRELGRRYVELTAEWTARLAAGEAGPPIELRFPDPRPRPDRSWGAEAEGLARVESDYRSDPPRRTGLRETACEDGPLAIADGALRPGGWSGPVQYLYFQVSDAWRFDARADLRLRVMFTGSAEPVVEYDSWDATATLRGAYTRVEATDAGDGSQEPRELTFELPAARLANRQNGGADLRLVVRSGDLAVRLVALELAQGKR